MIGPTKQREEKSHQKLIWARKKSRSVRFFVPSFTLATIGIFLFLFRSSSLLWDLDYALDYALQMSENSHSIKYLLMEVLRGVLLGV